MAYSVFNNSKPKSCFGSFNEPIISSDYLKNKKSKIIHNSKIKQINNKNQSSYENYNLFNNGVRLNKNNNYGIIPFSKGDLQVNLVTKMNLECVPTLSSSLIFTKYINNAVLPTSPTGTLPLAYFKNPNNIPFWYLYNIDPKGLLYGYNACTQRNYLKYMVVNLPKQNYTQSSETELIENCIF